MLTPNYFMLYVDSPERSATFYEKLLGKHPVELSPTFALFVLESGVKLALWSKHTVEPSCDKVEVGGGGEVSFSVASHNEVDSIYSTWKDQKISIVQQPVEMDFGYTFVALDPDGHRLRVFALSL